ncbi:hypothetical protein ACIBL3_09860 [Kribbella sp. NPDC050124]|uniref:hypothetical protein n=1 Tax=Kribbella sp. NPDC050124 TaxID=3364114 RepID=UPI0037AFFBBB
MSLTTYEIRVVGPVPEELLPQLGDVTITTLEMRTVLTGMFTDQAALHGFLQRLRAYGLDLVEVRSVVAPEDEDQPADTEPGEEGP